MLIPLTSTHTYNFDELNLHLLETQLECPFVILFDPQDIEKELTVVCVSVLDICICSSTYFRPSPQNAFAKSLT